MKNTIDNQRRQRLSKNISQMTEAYTNPHPSHKHKKLQQGVLMINGLNNYGSRGENKSSVASLPELRPQNIQYANPRSNSNIKISSAYKNGQLVNKVSH
jgi:hypothetical protein